MTTAHISGIFEVAINGRPYKALQQLHQRRFLDVIRQQADSSNEPSERSLNPNDLWRRSQNDWILGMGQEYYDDEESARKRYRLSSGLSPWGKGCLSLLNQTSRVDSLTGTIGDSVIAQGKLWVAQDTTLAIWDGSSWTNTSATAYQIRSIATDGSNVYIAARNDAKSAGKVYVITSGSTTPVILNDVIPDAVAYVRGRLMVSAGYSLFNITDVTTTDPPLALTAPAINEDWEWTAFGAGQSYIYVAGHSGDLSLIYRISLREDGTALSAPVVASQLPDGEVVNAISSYLQFVMLGTSKGLRVAIPQAGSLSYGAAVTSSGAVYSLEPQEEFVWAGTDDGGLVRADLRRFIPGFDLTPAYADDLDSAGSGNVTDVFTWNDKRLFIVQDEGVYLEGNDPVSEGSFYSGKINFGLPDAKQFRFLDVSAELDSGETMEVSASVDGSAASVLGVLTSESPSATLEIDGNGEEVEVSLTMTGGCLKRFTVRALPSPTRTEQIVAAIDLRESLVAMNNATYNVDVWEEFELLQGLARSGQPVDYQEFGKTYKVSIENVQLGPDLDVNSRQTGWEGICIVTMKNYE